MLLFLFPITAHAQIEQDGDAIGEYFSTYSIYDTNGNNDSDIDAIRATYCDEGTISWANLTSATEVTVSIDAPDEAALNSDFTANVNISEVVDFDACNYDVSFDASVLRLDDVTSGLIGSTEIPVDIYNEVSSGTWRVIQNVSGMAGVSGSGYLAVLHFHVIGSGGDSSTIGLSSGMLANNLAEEITATWTGASVRIATAASEDATPPTVGNSPPEATAPDTAAPLPTEPINWPVLWGVTGGVVVIGVIILSQALRRRR